MIPTQNKTNKPVITAITNFQTEYEVNSTEPNWLEAVGVVDSEDGVLTLTTENVNTSNVNMNTVGQFDVIYQVSDVDGNQTTKTITIHIVDTTAPVITGLQDCSLPLNSTEPNWLSGVTVTDNYDGTIQLTIQHITKTVNMGAVGSYRVTYTVADQSGNTTTQFITVNVIDTTAPIINGFSDLVLEVGSTEPNWLEGVSAIDAVDGAIILGIQHVNISNVNMNLVGSFSVIYTVSDSNQNVTTQSIQVTIQDTTAPILTLNGSANIYLPLGSNYQELGAMAVDNYDLNCLIVITGEVNTSLSDEYIITYRVTDSSQNVTELTRTIHVLDDISSLILDPNLKQAILEELDYHELAPISFYMASTIKSLDISNHQIEDLSGIQYFVNLETLWLNNNLIIDITPLSQLSSLTNLNLMNNKISHIDSLKTLYDNGAFRNYPTDQYHIFLNNNLLDTQPNTGASQVINYLATNQVLIDLAETIIEDPDGQSFETAKAILLGENLVGTINYINDNDYYIFTLTTGESS